MVNNGIKIDTKDLKGLESIKIPEINIDTINAKGLKKEMQQLEKDIAKGAKTIDGEYTNTLNGLRAQLRDMKKELGTLDLDVDADAFADLTDEISELNDKVKQMEQDYGTFSRNVGNYTESVVDALNEFDGQMYETAGAVKEVKNGVESLKGKQLFDVNIGGQVVQFENISQAIGEIDDMAHRAAAQMMELKNAGKENTEEYKKLNAEFQEFVQKSAELEKARKYADDLRDSMTSTTRGLDLGVQAFQALGNAMQMASGIAGLFGQNQEEIEKAINRTVQIMGIMQAAQELYQQTIQKGTVLNTLYSATFGKLNSGLTNMVGKLNLGTKAAKALNSVLKVNIFVAIASAILYVVNNLDKLSEILGITNEETKVFTNLWEKVSPVIMGFGKVVTDFVINPLRTLIKTISKVIEGDWSGAFDELKNGVKEQFNVIEDYQKGYADEVQAQAERATKKQKIELEKQLLHEKEYNEAKYGSDWKYTKDGIALYRKYFAAKLALYDKDSEEYRQALLEQISFERELKEHNENKSNSGGGSSGKTQADIQREIEDATIAAMKDGFSKRMAELKLQQKRELEEAGNNAKLKTALEAKHQREIEDLLEEHNEAIKKMRYEMEKNLVMDNFDVSSDYLNEYLTDTYRNIDKVNDKLNTFSKEWKRITNIDERSNLQKGLDNLGGDFGTDNISKFKKFTLKLKDEWNKFVSNIKGDDLKAKIEKSIEDLQKLENELFNGKKIDENISNNLLQLYTQSFKSAIEQLKEEYGDISKLNDEQRKEMLKQLNEIQDYYESRMKIVENYSSKEVGLILVAQYQQMEILDNETKRKKREETLRYNELIKNLAKQQEEELSNTELTQEEKKSILKYYETQIELATAQHKQRLKNIDLEASNESIEIEKNALQERSNLITRYNDIIYKEYEKTYDDIEKLLEEYSNIENVDLGSQELSTIGGFSTSVLESSRFAGAFKKMADEIKKQKAELVQQFQDGVITEEAFNKSYSELNLLEEQVNYTLKNITKSWQEWSAQIANVASAMVGIWAQMFSQIADLQYHNEMYEIERLQEKYDKETEMLQDALEEQEELFEKHNQNVESIEGELETARGDRRLFLLDQINAEMLKREQAWAQQQKIAKQQEQLEKKKEALEQRQKAAEQKRNKQNQKIQIAQATASTALAVTNALSVSPWFLGVALAAVAAAMGAVQIATIAKQKFADGGVIQGASHANGGVKVLGGSAEVEGGEYITNKVTTSKNVDVLTFINSKKKKLDLSDFVEFYSTSKSYTKSPKTIFADGGQLPDMQAPMINVKDVINANNQDNRPIYVSVTEIENVQNRVRNVRAVARTRPITKKVGIYLPTFFFIPLCDSEILFLVSSV